MFREGSGENGRRRAPKVGVLTFHRCVNYGSYWQARCLVEGLRGRGNDAVLLDYDCERTERIELRCAMQPLLPTRSPRGDIRLYARKARAFRQAIEALPLSGRFPLHAPEQMEACDLVMVGSDEVWNLWHPWYGGQALFWGQGLAAPRIVSYAASFGNYDADGGIDAMWAGFLRRFDAISVRDDNSRRLVRTALGSQPPLVLDPVLQFPPAIDPQWAAEPDTPFVALYGHSFSAGFAQAIRAWADRRGLRLVSIGYANAWAHEQRIATGPLEFAGLIARSSAVVTNFFHGCVFALVTQKPFACEVSPYRMNKVRDLAAAVGAEGLLVYPSDPPEQVAQALDRPLDPAIAARIDALRGQSERYLQAAGA